MIASNLGFRFDPRTLSFALAALLLLAIGPAALAADIPVDPADAYLRAEAGDAAGDCVPIELISLSLAGGDPVIITQVGDFDGDGAGGAGETQTSLAVTWSTSDTLDVKSVLERVTDAITTNSQPEIVTVPTCAGGTPLTTDVLYDFRIGGPGPTVVGPVFAKIPDAATHMFVCVPDCLHSDNFDSNADFGADIMLAPKVPSISGWGLVILVAGVATAGLILLRGLRSSGAAA